MNKKQSLSVTLKAKKSNPKIVKQVKKKKDPCMVCEKNLYYNADFSRRIGLISENHVVLGWMCPFCKSEFTENDELVTLKLEYDGIEGKS